MSYYESYFEKTTTPNRNLKKEYAQVLSCAQKIDQAIAVSDELLNKSYEYDVALFRAKNYLWGGKPDVALREFQELLARDSSNFECRMHIGDAYFRMKDYKNARSMYASLMSSTDDRNARDQLHIRMKELPPTGISEMLNSFPRPLAFAPLFNHYSDNLDFTLEQTGGILDFGLGQMLSISAVYNNLTLNSAASERTATTAQGKITFRPTPRLSVSGRYGSLNLQNSPKMNIGTFEIQYADEKQVSASLYYESNDAAFILYSPYLVDYRLDAKYLRISGAYRHPSDFRISGYFAFIDVSDGNRGNDVQVRLGKSLEGDIQLGYELQYMSYEYRSRFLPYSNGTQRYYYTPQNLDAHSLWLDWQLVKQPEKLSVNVGGKIGYYPLTGTTVREMRGNVTYNPFARLQVSGALSSGNSYRFDSNYSYFAATVTAYWRIY